MDDSRSRRIRTQGVCGLLLVLLAGCSLIEDSPPTMPSGATVRLSVDLPSAARTAPCTTEIRWTLTPRQPTGASGQKEQWSAVEQLWDSPIPDPAQLGGFVCEFTSAPAVLLSTGAWTFAFSAPEHDGSCLVTLHDGLNIVVYREGAGCLP